MPILLFFLFAFLFIYAEFSVLVWIGSHLGVFALILLLLLSAFIGGAIMRARGIYTLFHVKKQLSQGEIPTRSLFKSGVWMFAGVLFIIPGFLTDLFALILLTPLGSLWLERFVGNKVRFVSGGFSGFSFGSDRTSGVNRGFASQNDDNVFEAEFEKQADDDKRLK
ncbi:UPF0716 protein FxsA [Cricetibacter osteomyelitidis]|uniref:UPF0716 protein FxsA n=1 Tax=Cricetibacter osteomyelitidis TaxID=1521931 RepID=A0A4R2TK41_9PAST|nr:FxsA family protein [Cricetibacter osteomyelitidis]TCP95212.1 UPF0716 protein FxsA [Cricetibacter osteomyelitidis]